MGAVCSRDYICRKMVTNVHHNSPMSAQDRKLGLVEIHLAVFLFGFAGLFGKAIHASPAGITFGRTGFAALALLAALAVSRTGFSIRSPRSLFTLALSGVLLALHWFAFFQSIRVSTVAIGLLTFATFPLFVTFLEPLFFGEKLETYDVAAAVAVMAGLALVIPSFDFSNRVTQGVLWGLLSGVSFAALSLLNRMHVGKYPPLMVTFYQFVFAAMASSPFALASGPAVTGKDLLLMMVLGVVCTAAAHGLFIASLRHIRARTASIITGLEPVYGTVLALVLLGESPSLRTVFGGAVILGAVFFSMVRSQESIRR